MDRNLFVPAIYPRRVSQAQHPTLVVVILLLSRRRKKKIMDFRHGNHARISFMDLGNIERPFGYGQSLFQIVTAIDVPRKIEGRSRAARMTIPPRRARARVGRRRATPT